MMPSEFAPGRLTVAQSKHQAHVWVRDGKPTLTIISDAPSDFSCSWPEGNGPLLVFDSSFEVTVTVVQP